MVVERDHLTARVPEGFDLADVTFPLVDKHGCVLVKTNAYSVPLRVGSRVEARVYPLHVEVWHSGRQLARHERCYRRRQRPHLRGRTRRARVAAAFPATRPPAGSRRA